MRIVIQRVLEAEVKIDQPKVVRKIGPGMLILVGIEKGDDDADVNWIVQKVKGLRIFADEEGKMNRSIMDMGGETLVISQFTLHASTKKGNRPSFIRAAEPEMAENLYVQLAHRLQQSGIPTQTGVFGADMRISLINDGPVTILIDSKQKE